MTELTLLVRIYNSHQMKQIDGILEDLLGDLAIEATVKGTAGGRWVLLEITGEDEGVAVKLLEREIGFCPIQLEKVKKFAGHKGFITGLDRNTDAIALDVGVYQPRIVAATITSSSLQNTLADGKKLTVKRLSEMWGLCENLPLKIKVLEVEPNEDNIKAELQDGQIKKLITWKESLLDRLLVIGASATEISTVIDQEGLGRDVIDVEQLGVFEHALVCKLGTDAAGLVGSLGRHLRKAKFTVFNPKNLQ
jgi:hypothetical protein